MDNLLVRRDRVSTDGVKSEKAEILKVGSESCEKALNFVSISIKMMKKIKKLETGTTLRWKFKLKNVFFCRKISSLLCLGLVILMTQ